LTDAAQALFDRIGIPAGPVLNLAADGSAPAELPGDAVLLDISTGDVSLDELTKLIERSPALACLRLPDADGRQSDFDRVLFDAGFLRIGPRHDPWPHRERTSYLRSELVTDLDWLGEPTGGVVSMSTLGSNGRFGNQLFQWAFLKLYGLRSNCRVQTGYWVGNDLYNARAEPAYPKLRRQVFLEFNGIERTLWYMSEPPINLDFHGFFQEISPKWRRHKKLFQLLFKPHAELTEPIEGWLAAHIPAGSTTVGIHIRRGDYLVYDHQKAPWFRPIPVEWYRDLLQRLWPTLERPALIFASDEPGLVQQFQDFNPVVLPARELVDKAISFFPDFHALCRCDVLTVINSSFSHMAGLLGADGQRRFIPNMDAGAFEPYEPWNDDSFWERFGA
jgi:hypothetical protein